MKKNGFTLVELSIVLVIIGLLIAGILVGQSLIDNVKLKRAMSELGQYQIMVKQFHEKFKGMPGDINGFKFWGSACGGNYLSTHLNDDCNGNQDGNITYAGENLLFWWHMQFGGYLKTPILSKRWKATVPAFIPGDNIVGAEKFNKDAIYFPAGGGIDNFVMRVSRPNTHNADQPGYPAIPGQMMVAIDSKYDDGNALTGKVTGSILWNAVGDEFTDDWCANGSGVYYFSLNPSLKTGCVMHIGFIAY